MSNLIKLFINNLEKDFSGDIEREFSQKFVQATDNSIYQIIPDLIVYPKNLQDIQKLFLLGNKPNFKKLIFTARGGATATNGQSLNHGIVIDCSRYFRKIIKLNLKEEWIEVEPGITLKEVNESLKIHGYHFAPHISPDDRATIGGMISTDASGKGSNIHGKTSDHLISVDTILVNAEQYIFRNSLSKNDTDRKSSKVFQLVNKNKQIIKKSFPDHVRFATGYNLGKLIDSKLCNLSYLISGSEGSLGVITKARLKITRLNQYKALIITNYKNFFDAVKDAKNLLKFQPYAIETMDETILSLAKTHPIYHEIETYIQNKKANAINIIEFQSNTKKGLDGLTRKFTNSFLEKTLAISARLVTKEFDIKKIWELRSLGVGIAGNMQGEKKPIPFIEDVALPIENLVPYIHDLQNLLKKYQLHYVIYGHLDVGCLHVRPALDLRNKDEQKLIPRLISETIILVKKYQGIIWGEHGVGLRVSFSEEFFGKEILSLFRKIKEIFDPDNRLNPGKIVVPYNERNTKLPKTTDNLQANYNRKISKNLFQDFNTAIFCNGNTKCLSINANQVMCPSQKVTKEKIHSPKGRANLIRNWLTFRSYNEIPERFLRKIKYRFAHRKYLAEIYKSLRGCLGCKACSNDCPVKVDIPNNRSMFFEWYHKLYPRKIRDYLFCYVEEILSIMARYPLLYNFLAKNYISKFFILKIIGLNDFPELSGVYYKSIIQKLVFNNTQQLDKNTIFIVNDAFTNFIAPDPLIKTIELLQKLGFNVKIIPFFSSGKSYLNLGFIKKFKKIGNRNTEYLNKISCYGYPIISIEPVINLFFRDEYKKFFNTKFTVLLLSEFLKENINLLKDHQSKESYNLQDSNDINRKFYLLSHCMEKTNIYESIENWQEIFSAIGCSLHHIDSGCCGMSGSYGYEKEHKESSQELFNLTWKKTVNNISRDKVCVTGFSCNQQIKRFSGNLKLHPVEILLSHIS